MTSSTWSQVQEKCSHDKRSREVWKCLQNLQHSANFQENTKLYKIALKIMHSINSKQVPVLKIMTIWNLQHTKFILSMDQSTKQLQEKKQKYVCITDAQVIWGEKCHEKF